VVGLEDTVEDLVLQDLDIEVGLVVDLVVDREDLVDIIEMGLVPMVEDGEETVHLPMTDIMMVDLMVVVVVVEEDMDMIVDFHLPVVVVVDIVMIIRLVMVLEDLVV